MRTPKLFALGMALCFAGASFAVPTVSAPKPTVPADQVIAIYSDAYTVNPWWGYNENWNNNLSHSEENINGDKYLYYPSVSYLGWACEGSNGQINVLGMEKLHLDIWSDGATAIRVTAISKTSSKQTDLTLQAGKWNSFDVDLATTFAGLDLTTMFQFKFETTGDGNKQEDRIAFGLDNVYFYRTKAQVDTEAPTDLQVMVGKKDYFSIQFACSASDNSGVVNFIVFDGDVEVAKQGGASETIVNVDVAKLKVGTTYNFTIVATDAKGNKSEPKTVMAATKAGPTPAPAPKHAAADVFSLYSDVYEAATWFIFGGWGQKTSAVEGLLADEDKAYYFSNFNYVGVEIANNTAQDLSAYKYLHIDVYSLDPNLAFQISPIGGGETLVPVATKVNEWVSVDIPMSSFTNCNASAIAQMKLVGAEGDNTSACFIDNIYFSKSEASTRLSLQNADKAQARKIIENGQVYILRDGVRYNILGARVE